MRFSVAAFVLFASALFAAEPITVIEPSEGTVLRGGPTATIAWTATAPLPQGVVEWEAFLSVDGGRYCREKCGLDRLRDRSPILARTKG